MKHKTTIMIAEDEILIALNLEQDLIDRGYKVYNKICTGEDVVQSAQDKKPDIIIMDIRLAGKMDGIEAAKKILSFYHPAIIFMTGYGNEELKNRATSLNPLAFFMKPINMNKLQSAINSVM